MKKITFTFALLILTFVGIIPLKAIDDYNPIVDAFFNKFEKKAGITKIEIGEEMFALMNESKKNKELINDLAGIEGLRILTYDPSELKQEEKINLYNEACSVFRGPVFKVILDLDDNETQVKMVVYKESEIKTTDFVMIVAEEDCSVTIINIYGDLDMSEITKLSNIMNLKGLQDLDLSPVQPKSSSTKEKKKNSKAQKGASKDDTNEELNEHGPAPEPEQLGK